MFPYASIHPEVASAATDLLRFDYYRLVDPRDHRVFAYDRDGDRLIEVDGPFYQLWNQDDPCLNCSSRACLTMQDAVFKIEYLDGRVLHVTSVPMDIEGAELVLELIKDVTDSLLVADIEVRDNIEITQMITKFNELAVRDGFTKLYNKTFINNELESLVQAARGGSPAGGRRGSARHRWIQADQRYVRAYCRRRRLAVLREQDAQFLTLFRRVGRTFRRR